MNCEQVKKNLSLWADGELDGALSKQFEDHLLNCSPCQKEAQALQDFQELLIQASPEIKPSPDFEIRFWNKISERANSSDVRGILEQLAFLIPTPNFAQAVAVMLIAVMIGGAGGVVSAMGTSPVSKGISLPSVAGTYLKMIQQEARS